MLQLQYPRYNSRRVKLVCLMEKLALSHIVCWKEQLHSLYCFDNIITMAAKKHKIYYLCKYRMATSHYPKCFLTCLNPLGRCIWPPLQKNVKNVKFGRLRSIYLLLPTYNLHAVSPFITVCCQKCAMHCSYYLFLDSVKLLNDHHYNKHTCVSAISSLPLLNLQLTANFCYSEAGLTLVTIANITKTR